MIAPIPPPFQPSPPKFNTLLNPNTHPHLLIKDPTFAQLQKFRTLGLCYNYDEKLILGHKCKTSRFFFLWWTKILTKQLLKHLIATMNS